MIGLESIRESNAMPPDISADFPFASHYAEVGGTEMHYVEQGDGRPVLFLHGSPAHSYAWRNIIPHVALVGRCIAPDLIGMGKSGKPDIAYRIADHAKYLEAFIAKLGLEDMILVMHGWGAALGFDYALRFESRIRGLVFMEPIKAYADWEQFPQLAVETFRKFRSPVVGRELVIDRNVFIEDVLPRTVLRALNATEMQHYRAPFLKPEHREPLYRFANEVPIAGEPSDVWAMMAVAREWLLDTELPKLLLHATPGANMTSDEADWCRHNMKNVTVRHVGPGLHFIQEDCPHEIGSGIACWIEELLS